MLSKQETDVVHGMTGIVVTMLDKTHGILKFQHGTEAHMALFSTQSLYLNGYRANIDPKTLPPVFFDAYKIPESDKFEKFKWFAVLTWTGRRPNPKFCATKDDMMKCSTFRYVHLNILNSFQIVLKSQMRLYFKFRTRAWRFRRCS